MVRCVNRRCVLVACASLVAVAFAFTVPVGAARAADEAKPAWLGVNIDEVPDEVREALKLAADVGVVIVEVMEGGAAAKAGLMAGDVVTAADAKPAPTVEGFVAMIGAHKAGDTIELTIYREQKEQKIKVTLGERPE